MVGREQLKEAAANVDALDTGVLIGFSWETNTIPLNSPLFPIVLIPLTTYPVEFMNSDVGISIEVCCTGCGCGCGWSVAIGTTGW